MSVFSDDPACPIEQGNRRPVQPIARRRLSKPGLSARQSTTNRLNETAWAAMKVQLGL